MEDREERYIVHLNSQLSQLHQEALCRVSSQLPAQRAWTAETLRSLSRINARTARVLIRKGLLRAERVESKKGAVVRVLTLTEQGKAERRRINDECEGVDSKTGAFLFGVDTLPEGMQDGQPCDWNGKPLTLTEVTA